MTSVRNLNLVSADQLLVSLQEEVDQCESEKKREERTRQETHRKHCSRNFVQLRLTAERKRKFLPDGGEKTEADVFHVGL